MYLGENTLACEHRVQFFTRSHTHWAKLHNFGKLVSPWAIKFQSRVRRDIPKYKFSSRVVNLTTLTTVTSVRIFLNDSFQDLGIVKRFGGNNELPLHLWWSYMKILKNEFKSWPYWGIKLLRDKTSCHNILKSQNNLIETCIYLIKTSELIHFHSICLRWEICICANICANNCFLFFLKKRRNTLANPLVFNKTIQTPCISVPYRT